MATKKKQDQPGYDIVTTATVELLGVGLLTLLAGVNKQVGNVVVVIMVGFALAWVLVNSTNLQKWIGKA